MRKINVVLVGIGHDHAHDTFKTIIKLEEKYNILGIVLDNYDNGNYNKFKNEYDKYPHFSLDEALKLDNLDAAIIESDDRELTNYALAFAKKSIPVHMDKPGSQDKESFDSLIKICKANIVPLHLGYMYRYNPAIKEALKVIKSGAIGKIYYVQAEMSINHPKEKREWLNNFNGGMMYFLGCHLVDLIVTIMGTPNEVIPMNSRSSNDVGEDIGYAILKYNNIPSTIITSGVEFDGFSRRHILIAGETATIDIAPTELVINGKLYSKAIYKCPVLSKDYKAGINEYGPFDRYEEMFNEFYLVVTKEIENPYTYEHEQIVHDTLLKACIK